MAQITITLDLTPKNLELLKSLCGGTPAAKSVEKVKAETPTEAETPKVEAPVEAETPKVEAPVEVETPVKEEGVTLSDIRAIALKLSKAGQQEQLKEAFAKFGGKKLSDIKPENYAELMKVLSEVNTNA